MVGVIDEARFTAQETRSVERYQAYELFILCLSILSIFNLSIALFARDPQVVEIVEIVDTFLCVIFLMDFAWRVATAPDRRAYLKWGWLDFLGSLPFPVLRLLRLVRVIRVFRSLEAIGGHRVVRALLRDRAGSAILAVFLLSIVVLELGAIGVLLAERNAPNANIKTGGEALWWGIVSVTTVGYGDFYPVTGAGRLLGSLMLVVGIGLFSTFTGFLATTFARTSSREAIPEPPLAHVEREADDVIDRSAQPPG
jgi:voltage-gated potassium channel Kch